jgi:hypothetical protein
MFNDSDSFDPNKIDNARIKKRKAESNFDTNVILYHTEYLYWVFVFDKVFTSTSEILILEKIKDYFLTKDIHKFTIEKIKMIP